MKQYHRNVVPEIRTEQGSRVHGVLEAVGGEAHEPVRLWAWAPLSYYVREHVADDQKSLNNLNMYFCTKW